MNLYFEITPEHPGEIPEVTARIQAVDKELRGLIREAIQTSLEIGRGIAESEAPHGQPRQFREGVRIRDAIRISEVAYAPGGSGGGGFYEGTLYVDAALAPQIEFVMEGTADDGRGLIEPSQGNLHDVLAIEKEGEGVHFRRWVHGQAPQTAWWDMAHEEVERSLQAQIDNI